MRNAILTFVLMSCLLVSSGSYSSVNLFNSKPSSAQSGITEWVEYVLVGLQWYKITHLDDGTDIIQASATSGSD